jgi:D-alanine-D-alanine ligase
MNMHICILSSPTGDPEDSLGYDLAPYFNGYEWEHRVLDPNNVEGEVKNLMDNGVEVFVNICAGSPDDWLYDLPNVLINMGAAVTGAYGQFYDPPRAEMKDAAMKAGIPFPGSVFASTQEEVEFASRTLQYPLIVKPPHGWASMGIRKESRVTNSKDLHSQAALTFEEFDGVLIEEFIEGRELTALVVENLDNPAHPHNFQPIEYLFPVGESFKHVDMKWTNSALMRPVAVTDPVVDRKLRDYVSRMFIQMNGNGYARCDFRMNADGEIFMIEINPSCGVFDDPNDPACADSILLRDPLRHEGFLKLIIENAIRYQKMNCK